MQRKTINSGKKYAALSWAVIACLLFPSTAALTLSAGASAVAPLPQIRDAAPADAASLDITPPAATVKLIFIHHSTGQNWLDDANGGLGLALSQNNYFVSDTNYGWGPNAIGDRTDIPNWLEWFRDPNTPTYTAALYAESGQHSSYTRTLADPGGENEIVMFKSCFPNSALEFPVHQLLSSKTVFRNRHKFAWLKFKIPLKPVYV